jgi:hypothetical protein
MDTHRIALLSAVYVAVIAASFFLSLTIFNLLDWPQHVVETRRPLRSRRRRLLTLRPETLSDRLASC